jgi:hypothetical protein
VKSKFYIYFLVLTIPICFFSSCKKPNKELLIGTWELTSVTPLNPSEVDEKMTNEIQHYITYYDLNTIYFGSDKRFKSYNGSSVSDDKDVIEYRLINEKYFSDYPNFKTENENGNWVALVGIEPDGGLYKGTNIYSPFEIVSLTKDEFCLIIQDKFHGLESILNKYQIKYKRVENKNQS